MNSAARRYESAFIAVALSALSASTAFSQSVRGTVADAGGVPVPGVLIQLIGADSQPAARALTNDLGNFLLVAPRAGTYRVRTLRIGFKPVLSEPVTLVAGQEMPQQIALASISLGLDTVRVGGRPVCGKAYDAGSMTVAIWEQARAAMTSTAITGGMRNIFSRRVYYDQLLDNAGFRTIKQTQSIETVPVVQPWPAESPANLHQFGYIVQVLDSTVYRAPGMEMLASAVFFQDHCFKLANAKEKTQIAIEFDPTPDRRNIADIRGVVTLDRATAQLKSIEFRYVFPENKDLETGARGNVEFVRLANGAWGVARWNIRMPILEMSRAGQVRSNRGVSSAEAQVRVMNVRSTGGELALAMLGPDTLFSRPPLVLNGTVQDSLTGRDLAGARVTLQGTGLETTSDARGRFSLNGVLPGEYDLAVHTPGLDSLGTASETMVSITDAKEPVRVRVPTSAMIVGAICGARERSGIPGMLVGAVTPGEAATLPPNTKVSLEWTETGGQPRSVTLPIDAAGNFRMCGVPVATSVTLRAAADSVRATPVIFVLAAEKPVENVLLELSKRAVATATLAGTVVVDSGGSPIAGVEIMLPSVGLNAHSDTKGAYRLPDVPVGTHRVLARKPGYSPLDATLTFAANETVTRRLVLSRVTVLNEVVVTTDRAMRTFEEHKALGLGRFLTREFLELQEGNTMSAVMSALPGVRILPGMSSGSFRPIYAVTSNRRCLPDFRYGAKQECRPCFALIIFDGVAMNPYGGEPFDINSLPVREIEAIEHYPSPSIVPDRYRSFETACGLVVIHTRRTLPPAMGTKP
jgi:hypothetical protein